MKDLIRKILKESEDDFGWAEEVLQNPTIVGFYDLRVGDVIQIDSYGIKGFWRVLEIGKLPLYIRRQYPERGEIKIKFELVQKGPDGSFFKKSSRYLEMSETPLSKDKIFTLVDRV